MGMRYRSNPPSGADCIRRLLQSPFDYAQAFDQALKNIVAALPNRPSIESAEDVVRLIAPSRSILLIEV